MLDVFAVRIDGLYTQLQLNGDLPRAETRAEKLENMQLAVGEILHRGDVILHFRFEGLLKNTDGDFPAHVNFLPQHGPNRGDDFFGRLVLHQISLRAGTQRALRKERFIELREDEDQQFRILREQAFNELDERGDASCAGRDPRACPREKNLFRSQKSPGTTGSRSP